MRRSSEDPEAAIHPTAVVEEGAVVGAGTRVWHLAHIRSGAQVGAGCVIGRAVFVDAGAVIGDACKVQNFVSVYSGVTLEDEVFVGPSAVFTNDRTPRAGSDDWRILTTVVQRGASIGGNATIVCGVTIGEWAMVGAGAVVIEDVERHALVIGNPARRVGWVCRCGERVPGGPGADCPSCGERLGP